MSATSILFGRISVALVAVLVLLVSVGNSAELTSETPALSVTWRLIENHEDNKFVAELTLTNSSQEALDSPWSLYFNTAAKTSPGDEDSPFKLEHVNGDLYALQADARAPTIRPGESLTVKLIGSPWAINVSDAPSGFYLVRRNDAGRELTPTNVPLTVGPFPAAEKIRRGGGDQMPVVTSAARYAENASLIQLPLDELPPVVPTPAEYERLPGRVAIDGTSTIEFDPQVASEAQQLIEVFSQALKADLKRAKNVETKSTIRLSLGTVQVGGAKKLPGDEAYTLSVTTDQGIEIVGTDAAGVFYGIQTLRGLVPLAAYRNPGQTFDLPSIRIADAPRFGYRGLHLDVGRNFQNAETVKRLLDRMAFYKLNRFHWHLTDDEGWRFEVKSLPELTEVGSRRGHTTDESDRLIPSYGSGPDVSDTTTTGSGFYTQEQFIDVLRYAKARHILVIPEIDVPGHSRAAVRAMAVRAQDAGPGQPDLRLIEPGDTSKYESVQSWNDNVMDVGREATYEFLEIVIGELAAMYRTADATLAIVHLGGDEVPRGAWESSPACRNIPVGKEGLTRGQQLEVHFLKRACQIVAKHGARPAAWDDCLLFAIDDQDWAERPIAYVWNSVLGWGREDAAYRLANAGFDVVLSSATHLYFDLANEKAPQDFGYYWAGFVGNRAPFDFNPYDLLRDARTNSMGQPLAPDQFAKSVQLSTEGRKRILGMQGQLWAENLRSAAMVDAKAFPGVIALAERAWSAEPAFELIAAVDERAQARDAAWNQFANALGQRELPRLKFIAGDVDYRLPPPGVIVEDGKVRVNVAFPGTSVRFTDDGTLPTANSPIFDAPLPFNPRQKFRAFDANGHGSRSAVANDR